MDKQPSQSEDSGPLWWQQTSAWLVRYYNLHRNLFVGLNVVLTAVNIYTGKPWWALWPLLVTGALFTLHFLVYRAVTVDDEWVDQRAADLYDKSYDQGHIDAIAERAGLETTAHRRDREAASPPAAGGHARGGDGARDQNRKS